MPKFEFDLNSSLGNLASKKLGEDLKTEIATIGVKKIYKARNGDFSYELGGDLSFKLELFNSEKDKDSRHKVLGKVPGKAGSKTVHWQPLIDPGKTGAWLKYSTSAEIKPGTKIDFGPVLGIRTRKIVDHFYYHKHPRTKLLSTAVAQDMAAQKNVFSVSDVLSLGPDEALGLASGGNPQISLKFSWSDILTTGATSLAGLVTSSEAIGLRISAGATATVNLALADDFKLVFLGLRDGRIRVALRKSESSTLKAGVVVGIEARLGSSSDLSKILNEVMAGLLGVSLLDYRNALKALQNHAELEKLSIAQRLVASQMLERLGLDDEITRTKDLLRKLADLEKEVTKKINSIVVTRAKLSFAYEYSRIDTDASILEADLETPAMKRLFSDLLAGRFQVLLSDSRKFPEQIEMKRFLNQDSFLLKLGLGLSLGIGKWSISGKENTRFSFVSQKNSEKAVRHAILGSRTYTGDWFGSKWSTFVEFKAAMENFKPRGVPVLADDFSLGLSLNYSEGSSRTRAKHIKNLVDTALLFGAGPEGDIDRLVEDIVNTISGNQATQSTVLMTLGDSEVKGFSRWIARRRNRQIAEAFASAMPYWKQYPQTIEVRYRRKVYRRIWEMWLSHPFKTASEASAFAYTVLRGYNTSLANEERKARKSGKTAGHTLYRRFSSNKDMLKDFRKVQDAFTRLNKAIEGDEPYKKLASIARDIHRFANTPFKIRVMGRLVTDFRHSQPAGTSDISSSLRIRHNREKNRFKDAYVISHKF